MVKQVWSLITLRNPEDGGDMFSDTSIITRATWHEVPESSMIDTAMKTSQKTVFFDYK
jgi:hypothetical protein